MVLNGVMVVDSAGERCCDVEIRNGKIVDITPLADSQTECRGYLMRPLCDLNVKPVDDRIGVETLKDLADKALKGGVGTIMLNPDLSPAIDNEIVLEFVRSQGELINRVSLMTPVMAVDSREGAALSEIATLLKKGASSIFFYSDMDSFLICRVFEYAKMYGVTLECRAKNGSIRGRGVMHEGEVSAKLGLAGINELEEVSEVAKIVEFAAHYRVPVLFKSVSCYRSVELISKAKSEGIDLMCEVSIHHLLKTDRECDNYNTAAKIDPPLRDEKNRVKLIEALKSGEIDILTSLHSPKSNVRKDISFDEADFGAEGLEQYLSAVYENLVVKEKIPFFTIYKATVENPAKIAGYSVEELKPGSEGDFILFDGKSIQWL